MMIENTENFNIEDNELDIKDRTQKIPKGGINQFSFSAYQLQQECDGPSFLCTETKFI